MSRLPNGPFSHVKLTENFDDVSVGITKLNHALGKIYVRGSGNRFLREFLNRRRDMTETVSLVAKKKGCHVPTVENSRGKRFLLHAHAHKRCGFVPVTPTEMSSHSPCVKKWISPTCTYTYTHTHNVPCEQVPHLQAVLDECIWGLRE